MQRLAVVKQLEVCAVQLSLSLIPQLHQEEKVQQQRQVLVS